MGDKALARQFWQNASETGPMELWTVSDYLDLLAEEPLESRAKKIIQLLRSLQSRDHIKGYDYLTIRIHVDKWPCSGPQSFFRLATTAAKQTNSLPWLVGAYETAVAAALGKSHSHPAALTSHGRL